MLREIHFIHPAPDGTVNAQVVSVGMPWGDGMTPDAVIKLEVVHRDPVFDRGMVNVPSTVKVYYGESKDVYRNAVIIRETYGEIQ